MDLQIMIHTVVYLISYLRILFIKGFDRKQSDIRISPHQFQFDLHAFVHTVKQI